MKRIATVLALAALAGCSSGSTKAKESLAVTSGGGPDAQTATVLMADSLTFVPNLVNAKVGKLTLTATNKGNTPHNLTFADKALGKTSTISGKESGSLTLTFDKAGTYSFRCTFHEGMTGKVVVS